MTAGAVGAAVALVVTSALARVPAPARRPAPDDDGADDRTPSAGPLAVLGGALVRLARVPGVPPERHRTIGATTVAALAGAVVLPPLLVAVPAAQLLRHRLRALRARRLEGRAVADALPEVVDLLHLCSAAGIALPLAVPLVAEQAPPPLGPALRAAEQAAAAGTPRADALTAALRPFGDRATDLGQVLADHLRYGVALAPALHRVGLELRLDRRRRAEQDARRVPVRLLAPLIACVLPAFGLLTVVPLLVASLRSLPA